MKKIIMMLMMALFMLACDDRGYQYDHYNQQPQVIQQPMPVIYNNAVPVPVPVIINRTTVVRQQQPVIVNRTTVIRLQQPQPRYSNISRSTTTTTRTNKR
jgi:hypothetical protein